MTQKQDGGSNQCISVYTAILSPGNKINASIWKHLNQLMYAAPLYSYTKSAQKLF